VNTSSIIIWLAIGWLAGVATAVVAYAGTRRRAKQETLDLIRTLHAEENELREQLGLDPRTEDPS
jgi:hypothetical protein